MSNTTTFHQRLNFGKEYETEVMAYWQQLGFSCVPNGAEILPVEFHKIIITMSDSTSKYIRYRPDKLITNGKYTAFIEIKHSQYIEKEPYLHYQELDRVVKVIICIKHPHNRLLEYWVPFQFLKLIHGSTWNHPVDFDGWIDFSAYNDPESGFYNVEKWRSKKGSGKPFKEIDFEHMNEWKITSPAQREHIVKCIFKGHIPRID